MHCSQYDAVGVSILVTMQTKKIKTSREIGEMLKKKRRELGISQEELAERLGVTYQQIQRYENGVNKLNVENIQIIAEALDVPVSYFFDKGRTDIVAEGLIAYLPEDECKLLAYFWKIKDKKDKNLVLQTAKLAARVKT